MTDLWMGESEVINNYNALFNTNALITKTGSVDNYKQHATHLQKKTGSPYTTNI
jgi:hypothetical protein